MSSSRDLGPRPGRHPGLRGLTPATLATAAILVIRIVLHGVGDAGAPSLRAGVEELRAAHLGLFGLGVGPSSLAMVACIVQLIPVVGLVVGPLVWFAFMVRMDLLQSTLDD